MRLAVIAPPWIPVPPVDYGGTELIVDILCRGYQARGHEVVLFCSGDSTCPVDRIASNTAGALPPDKHAEHQHFALALAEIQRGQFDAVHCHLEGILPYAQLLSVPVLTTVHVPMTLPRERLLSQSTSPVIAVSADQASTFPRPTSVVHHGLELHRYHLVAEKDDYLLWLGSVTPEKGLEAALEIAEATGMPMKVAGPVPEGATDWWRNICSSTTASIEYCGLVGFADKAELLARARALMMMVNWQEPFGLVAVEAMASGTPVLANRRGALPEIVEDGVSGFLCDSSEDAISAIGRLHSLKAETIRSVAMERFSAERMVSEYLQLLGGLSS